MAPPAGLPADPQPQPLILPTPLQANLFYLAAVALGLQLGRMAANPLLSVVIKQLLIFGLLPLAFAAAISGSRWSAVFRLRGVSVLTAGKCAFLSLLNFVFAQGISTVVITVLWQLGLTPVSPYTTLLQGTHAPWLVLVAMALVPALLEEWAFRGFLLTGYQALGKHAWIWAGLAFALMHGSLVRLPALAALGMIFALAAQRTGSLVPGLIMHMLNNSLAIGLFYTVGGRISNVSLAAATPPPWIMAAVWGVAALVTLPAIVAVLRSLPTARPEPAAREPGPAGPTRLWSLTNWWPMLAALAPIAIEATHEIWRMAGGH